MKRITTAALVTVFVSSATWAGAEATVATKEKVVGPGVTWSSEFRPDVPLNFNVMRVQVDNPHVTLETESAGDRLFAGEKVLDSVKREEEPGRTEIIGGVNADFWAGTPRPYSPIGLLVADGMIYNMPAKRRSAFVFTADENSYIGPVSLEVKLQGKNGTLSIDRINSGVKSKSEIVLFTPPYGDTVEAEDGRRFLLTMVDNEFLPNKPLQITIAEADSALITPLSEKSMVLHVPPDRAGDVPVFADGETLTLSAVLPQVNGVVRSVCGGGPAIVKNGKVNIANEGMGESFSETKHPRTALGYSKDRKTIYLVTVDGRQPRVSVGASLEELAQYMVSLGCWDAINLDGGGSTSMVVNDKIVNKPSDFKGARTVANSLLVVAEAGSGEVASLTFDPSGEPLIVPAGATVKVEISALDENQVPVGLKPGDRIKTDSSEIVDDISIDGHVATIKFIETASSGRIQFSIGDVKGRIPVHLVKLDKIITEPASVVLGAGDAVAFHAAALSNGEKVDLRPEMIEVNSADATIATVNNGTVKGLKKGKTRLSVKIGSANVNTPVYVDMARGHMLEDFEAIDDLSVEGSQFDEKSTNVTLERENVKEGLSSARINYTMTKGGRTRINIPLSSKIDEAPAGLSIWVYGDGQEAWFRANLIDDNGTLFIADFTNGADGITWKNEWRHLTVPFQALIGTNFDKSPRPVLPLKVEHLVIAQDQEALKRSGTILLDGFQALYPPE